MTAVLLASTTGFVLPPVPAPALTAPALTAPALHATGQLLAAADPFADPVFTGAAAADCSTPPVLSCLLFYFVGMAALTAWDEWALPRLQQRGIMPKIPGEYDRTKDLEPLQPIRWLTPLTADRAVPLPVEIDDACVRIGTVDGAHQFICAQAAADALEADVCILSDGFSDHFGRPITICSRGTR